MWAGHLIISLLIPFLIGKTTLFAFIVSVFYGLFPNLDGVIEIALSKKGFHSGPFHSISAAFFFSIPLIFYSRFYFALGFLSYLLHLLADLPTDKGIEIFWPFIKKRYSLPLWKETGFFGISSIKGYYRQKWPKIIEFSLLILLILLLIKNVI